MAQLTASLRALAPWTHAPDLPAGEWDRYIATARDVQRADPPAVEEAIAEFLGERAGFEGAEDETRVFLLLRVVFDLPERAPADQREAYAGWVNWPPADDGTVSLCWPIAWRGGRPALVAPYEGSEGESYAGVEEYRRLRERYPYRDLPG